MQGCGRNSHGSGFDRREASKLTSCCWHAWCALSGVPAEASSSGRSGDPSRRYRYGEGDPHHHAAGVGGDHLRRRDGVARTAPGHRQEGGAYIHPCKETARKMLSRKFKFTYVGDMYHAWRATISLVYIVGRSCTIAQSCDKKWHGNQNRSQTTLVLYARTAVCHKWVNDLVSFKELLDGSPYLSLCNLVRALLYESQMSQRSLANQRAAVVCMYLSLC